MSFPTFSGNGMSSALNQTDNANSIFNRCYVPHINCQFGVLFLNLFIAHSFKGKFDASGLNILKLLQYIVCPWDEVSGKNQALVARRLEERSRYSALSSISSAVEDRAHREPDTTQMLQVLLTALKLHLLSQTDGCVGNRSTKFFT